MTAANLEDEALGEPRYDGLGSVVNLTSPTGATWWTYSYLPYGGVRTATKNSNQAPARK